LVSLGRQSARLVDKIARGERPEDRVTGPSELANSASAASDIQVITRAS
jgi:hypothetical protein